MQQKNIKRSSIKPVLVISKAEIERIISAQIPEILFESNEDGLSVKAAKGGILSLEAKGNVVEHQLPIRIEVRKQLALAEGKADCKIRMRFKTKYEILPNWKIQTETEFIGHEWDEKPFMKVGFLEFPIEKILLNKLYEQKDLICNTIDQQIMDGTDLSQMIPTLLSGIPNPIDAPGGAKIWWSVSPVQTYISPFSSENDNLKISLRLESKLALSAGKKPKTQKLKVKAPKMVEKISPFSNLYLPLQIGFDAVQKIANEQLTGMDIPVGKAKLKFSDVSVKSKAGRLIIRANFSGGFSGKATIKGIPVYDKQQKEIIFEQVKLDLKGDNLKSKGMALVAENIIEQQLSKFLKLPLKTWVKDLNEWVKYQEVQPGIILKAHFSDYDFKNVEIGEESLNFQLDLEGMIAANIQKIPDQLSLDDVASN